MITIKDADKYRIITLIIMILTILILAIEKIIPSKNNNINKKIFNKKSFLNFSQLKRIHVINRLHKSHFCFIHSEGSI